MHFVGSNKLINYLKIRGIGDSIDKAKNLALCQSLIEACARP